MESKSFIGRIYSAHHLTELNGIHALHKKQIFFTKRKNEAKKEWLRISRFPS